MDNQAEARNLSETPMQVSFETDPPEEKRLQAVEASLASVREDLKSMAILVTAMAGQPCPGGPFQESAGRNPALKWLQELWTVGAKNPRTTAMGIGCLALAIDLFRQGQFEPAVLATLAGIGKILGADAMRGNSGNENRS